MEPVKVPWPSSSHNIQSALLHRTQSPSIAQGANTQREPLPMAATRRRESGAKQPNGFPYPPRQSAALAAAIRAA